MDNDDFPVGRVLSRREALRLLGAISAASLAACSPALSTTQSTATTVATTVPNTAVPTTQAAATAAPATAAATVEVATVEVPTQTPPSGVGGLPSCIVRPELTEGPFFVDQMLNRSDVRSDPDTGAVSEGAPLQLTMRVSQISGTECAPLAGAQVDIWHCDALGVYSAGTGAGQKFLRGYQVTDANGAVTFTTIYPGWYRGRAVHIHFKIRADAQATMTDEFTSQLFFDDTLTQQVYSEAPYAARGLPSMSNADDSIFNSGGDQLLLEVKPAAGGYATTFDIGLQTA